MEGRFVADEAVRLDKFLCLKLQISRRRAKYLIEKREVKVNSKYVPKRYCLKKGDVIEVNYVPEEEVLPDDSLPIPIIFENEYIVALDKPSGIPLQPVKPEERGTVANFVVSRYPQTKEFGLSVRSPGILNRLDTLASGIILVAKEHRVFSYLREQFRQKNVKKWFYVVVEGRVERKGKVDVPLAHHPRSARRMIPLTSESISYRGKVYPALTYYYPEKVGENKTLLKVRLVTGVTHQIRVHMKYIGHPVCGDPLYGKSTEHFDRIFIHLAMLGFEYLPGRRIVIESPPPSEFYS